MQRAKEKQKSPWYDYLILLCFAFFTLLFFTKSSPLFYLNDWVDSNAYFTVGKGIIHGLIPYRDLFEQKGPLLYFIHAGAYLIERKNFTGVYVFQSIGLFISLLFAYKTLHPLHYTQNCIANELIFTSATFNHLILSNR